MFVHEMSEEDVLILCVLVKEGGGLCCRRMEMEMGYERE